MSKRLPYGLARRVENFCQGTAMDGDEFWLQVLDVPEIDKNHKVKVPVLLGYMTEHGIEVIGEFNVHCYPSVLDELDREMQLDTWYPGMQWYQVCYEVKAWETKDGRLMHSRKMKIYSVRDVKLPQPPPDGMQTGPPKPAAVVQESTPAVHAASGSERGQAGAGGAPYKPVYTDEFKEQYHELTGTSPPADPCPDCKHAAGLGQAYCGTCGKRVG